MLPEHDPEFLKVVAWAQERFEVDRWLIAADKLEERHPQRAGVLRQLLALPMKELPMTIPTSLISNNPGARLEFCGRRPRGGAKNYLRLDHCYHLNGTSSVMYATWRDDWYAAWYSVACNRCSTVLWGLEDVDQDLVRSHVEETRMRQCLWIAGATDVSPRHPMGLWTTQLEEFLLGRPIRWTAHLGGPGYSIMGVPIYVEKSKYVTTRFLDGTCVTTVNDECLTPVKVWQEDLRDGGPIGPSEK